MTKKFNLVSISSLVTGDVLRTFDCHNYGINQFFYEEALDYHLSNKMRVNVLLDGEKIIGFFGLTVGTLETENPGNKQIDTYPYVNLAFFAIDYRHQGKGIGNLMMEEVFKSTLSIAYYAGVELIYLKSVDESVEFYEKSGFELIDPRLRPEIYQVDTNNILFPMMLSIDTLYEQGYLPYQSLEAINIEVNE